MQALALPPMRLGDRDRREVQGMLLLGVGITAYQVYLRWRYRPRNTTMNPVYQCLGPFGNIPDFLVGAYRAVRSRHLEHFHEKHETVGDTIAFKLPVTPWWVMTRDPKNIQHILSTNFSNYPKGPWFTGILADLLGGGIFNTDGDSWHSQRKISSRMFTARLFKEHIWAVVQRNAEKLVHVVGETQPGESVDIFSLMNRFTLDTIGEVGFGKSIGSLEDPSSPFLLSFDRAQQITFSRFFIPFWKVLRFLRVGFERGVPEHFGRLDAYSRDVVRELRDSIAKGDVPAQEGRLEARRSFVGLFLEDAQRRGEDLSDDFLRDLVLNFLIAGRDTTAQALSWTLYCLCNHPEVAEKAREEAIRVCGGDLPAYDDVGRLPYIQAVLNEALRLFPSVPLDVKVAEQDDTWPDGTQVRRGNIIFYNVYSLGRDRKQWGEDAEQFRPERWLEMDAPPDPYKYPVFNAGPRECLGKRLAIFEMKTCLAVLLPKFSFKLAVPRERVIPDGQLTIGMGRGLPCFVERVSGASKADAGADPDPSQAQGPGVLGGA